MPKKHNGYFCRLPQEELPAFAAILRETIIKLKKTFTNLSYNFIIHTSPINTQEHIESYHWHLELMPKLTRVAGFEWGSGFYLVPTPPELAAEYLSKA